MTEMTGGMAIVKSLIRHGQDTVFGVPGIQLDALYNAFYDERNAIRVLNTRHEQGAAYMAFGYAQATGRTGAYAVVPGPGLLNTTAALATAYACNAPVLAITGQVPSGGVDKEFGLLHEIKDQFGLIKHLTKWAQRIEAPADAPAAVEEAYRQLNSGRRRPVEIEMAMDIMHKSESVGLIEGPVDYGDPQPPDPDSIEAAAKIIGAAKNPLIVVGFGAVEAGAEVLELAEMLQAPVVSQRGGRGVVSSRHYLEQIWPAGHRLWRQADVVIGIGSRLQQAPMVWGTDDDMAFVKIDIDPDQIKRPFEPDVAIVADAATALGDLIPAVAKHNIKRDSRKDEFEELKRSLDKELRTIQPQYDYLMTIRNLLPEDGIFVDELTQVGYAARLVFPVYKPRTFLTAGYQGTLGSGFATALGAQVGKPDTPVVSINGDGGFMFNIQELSTAAKYNIPLVAIVFNDNSYGNVQRMQIEDYDNRVIATDLKNPDFAKLAELFGVQGLKAASPDELKAALSKGLDSGGPTLIEVSMAKEVPSPWGYIHMPKIRGNGG